MGVPQGSILSVTLFGLQINSIVKCISPEIDGSLYVDDFLICYRSKNMHTIKRQMQQCLNKIQDWSHEVSTIVLIILSVDKEITTSLPPVTGNC